MNRGFYPVSQKYRQSISRGVPGYHRLRQFPPSPTASLSSRPSTSSTPAAPTNCPAPAGPCTRSPTLRSAQPSKLSGAQRQSIPGTHAGPRSRNGSPGAATKAGPPHGCQSRSRARPRRTPRRRCARGPRSTGSSLAVTSICGGRRCGGCCMKPALVQRNCSSATPRLCPDTGLARLSYDQVRDLLDAATSGPGTGWDLHEFRHCSPNGSYRVSQ